MSDFITQLRRDPEPIEAAQVKEHTAEKIALWCGGDWSHQRDRGVDTYLEVVVPNIEGNQKAHVNDYVVRKTNGRFYVMTGAQMADEGYKEYGKRELSSAKRAQIEEVMGVSSPKDQMGRVQPLTPHYAARNSPFSNGR